MLIKIQVHLKNIYFYNNFQLYFKYYEGNL